MTLPQPPDESSETSFWVGVYDEDPPHIICGVLTDLNLHRFALHQHLTTNAALTETPLLHQTFQDALPPALHRHVRNYNTNLHLANVHLRRALDALDALGRHPPHIYLRDPHAGDDDPPATTSAEPPFPTTSTLSRANRSISRPRFGTIYPLSNLHHQSSNTAPHRPLHHTPPPTRLSKLTSSLPHP